MKLTQEQVGIILSKLNDYKDSRKPCIICGKNQWSLSNKIMELKEFREGSMALDERVYVTPLISITCKNCGNTHLLNAIKLGLIIPTNKQRNAEENTEDTDK